MMPEAEVQSPIVQLKESLDAHASRVIDLFRKWDIDGDGTVDKKEFRAGLEHLGFGALASHAETLFDTFDENSSGTISFKELHRVLRKVKPEAAKVKVQGDGAVSVSNTEDLRKEVTKWVLKMTFEAEVLS